MQYRTAALLVYLSLLLLTTEATRRHHNNLSIDAHDSIQEKELEQNLNNLQHEQLFLPKESHLSSLYSELNKDKLEWITLPKMNPSTHKVKLLEQTKIPSKQHPSMNNGNKEDEQPFPLKKNNSSQHSRIDKGKAEWATLARMNPSKRRSKPHKKNQTRPHHPSNKDHSRRMKLGDMQSNGRRAARGFSGVPNQMKKDSKNKLQRQLHPTTPKNRKISRFQMRRHKGAKRGQDQSKEAPSMKTKTRTHMKMGRYLKDLPVNLHRLDLGSQHNLKQKGRQRSERSSCTDGKVWRRGQCRCPSLSNWDEEKSECVCIYGTYKDALGNCRSFI
ncbi:uncharacterized protein [Palaemon carinicauda]|uniref:uncharacterized protein n=1 Tax=Palaemon carinicauda TaxID=392227 RepID=UPI0035B5C9FF